MGGTLILIQAFFMNFLFSPHGISVKRILFFPLVLQGRGNVRMWPRVQRVQEEVAQMSSACPQAPAPCMDFLWGGGVLLCSQDPPIFQAQSCSWLVFTSFRKVLELFQAIVI